MKYLKFYVLSLIVLIGFIVSGNEEVYAYSINFDFGNNSPRFQYLYDEDNELIPFEFEIFEYFDNALEANNNDFYLSLEQVTYNGEFIKQLSYYNQPDFNVLDSDLDIINFEHTAIGSIIDSEIILLYDIDFNSISNIEVNGVSLSETDYELIYSDYYEGYLIALDYGVSIVGDTITVYYVYDSSNSYVADIYYDWSGLQFNDNNIAFYRLILDETIIWAGAVMLPPQDSYLPYDTYGIEVGDFLVEGDGTVDSDLYGFTDQTQFTSYEDDRYLILHYRIPTASVADIKFIKVIDIINNTQFDSISTDDILNMQGGGTVNFANSFIVVPIDGILSDGLATGISFYDASYDFLSNEGYDEGSYYFSMIDPDTGDSFMTGSSVVWNVTTGINLPFDLYLSHDNLNVNSLQRVIFYKYSEIINTGYETKFAKDFNLSDSYVEVLNDTTTGYSVEYYPDEDLLEGETSYFSWRVKPLFMPYSLDVDDFTISMREDYIYGENRGIGAEIETLRTVFGMSDDTGGIIFSIFILVFINGILLFITRENLIYAVSNLAVVGVLSYLSLIPMWFIMAVVLLAFLGFKLNSGGADSYE